MGGLAGFVMRSRSQAAMVATLFAMLALLLPALSILSSAVVGLVTLRQGFWDGLLVGLISALASGLLALLLFGNLAPVVSFLVVLWLPVWLLGGLLRVGRSLDLAVQAGLLFGLALLGVLYLQADSPLELWRDTLQPLANAFVESNILEPSQSPSFIQEMAAWMSGVFAAAFYLQLVLSLFVARAWQARLYNPGGFRQEFHTLRAHRLLGLGALPLLLGMLWLGATGPALVRDLGVLLMPLFFLQGLAVAHASVAGLGLRAIWLVILYGSLIFPDMLVLVTLLGLADVFLDIRGRLPVMPKRGP